MKELKHKIGDKASISKSFSKEDVLLFSKLSLDENPIHLNEEFAKLSVFKKNIVHGMLVSSLFSCLLGTKLPGSGTIYLGQSLKFVKPIFVDEEVTAIVEIISIREDKPIMTLKTIINNSLGELAIEGEAIVKYEP